MTNTQQMTMNQEIVTGKGLRQVNGYAETNLLVVRARISERQAEAANARLAALSRGITSRETVRRHVGRLLISAGYRVGGETVPSGRGASRPARRLAA